MAVALTAQSAPHQRYTTSAPRTTSIGRTAKLVSRRIEIFENILQLFPRDCIGGMRQPGLTLGASSLSILATCDKASKIKTTFATKLPLEGKYGRRRSCFHSGLNDRLSLGIVKLSEQPTGHEAGG